MDLGKLTGKTLDLPLETTLIVVDFSQKKVVLRENIENSTFDPKQWERIKEALNSLGERPKTKKKSAKTA